MNEPNMNKTTEKVSHFVAMFLVSFVWGMLPSLVLSLLYMQWWEHAVELSKGVSVMSFIIAFVYSVFGLYNLVDTDDSNGNYY